MAFDSPNAKGHQKFHAFQLIKKCAEIKVGLMTIVILPIIMLLKCYSSLDI